MKRTQDAYTGATEQLTNLPSDTPRPLNFSIHRTYLLPILIIAVMCLILASFHAGSGLPRWQEWGWNKAKLGLFLCVSAPLASVGFSLVCYTLLSAYKHTS
jgi:hypothetical protein